MNEMKNKYKQEIIEREKERLIKEKNMKEEEDERLRNE